MNKHIGKIKFQQNLLIMNLSYMCLQVNSAGRLMKQLENEEERK